MMKWTFWEWVAYAILFVAAIIVATDQGLKLAPDLAASAAGLLHSPWWAFSPLVLILFATAILVGRELGWIGVRKPAAAASVVAFTGPSPSEADYSADPEAEAPDKHAYKEILAFALDLLLPACEAQVELQGALILHASGNNATIAALANMGLRHSDKTKGFWNHYIELAAGLVASPGPIMRFEPIIEHIAALESGEYREFSEQLGNFAVAFAVNLATNETLRPFWLKWAEAHNALVDSYDSIKRDPRFGRLLRPGRPSRWGDQIDSRAGYATPQNMAEVVQPSIQILFEPQPPYETSEISRGRGLSTVRIGLKAVGKTFSNCQVYIDKIAPVPPLPGGLPLLLSDNAPMLRADDPETLINVAWQWDHVGKYRFSTTLPPMDSSLWYIDDDPPRLIEIKVTARSDAGEFQKTALFRIWVDEAKRIHLERQQA